VNRTILRGVGLAVIGTFIVTTSAACSGTPAAPDYLVLRYSKKVNGGGLSFKECVQPSRKAGATHNDQNFALPTSLRGWNITPEGQGGDSIIPVQTGTKRVPVPGTKGETQPGADVKVYTRTQFFLNTDCGPANKDTGLSNDKNSTVVQFWENVGRRSEISQDDENGFDSAKWTTMLQNTLVTAEMAAIRNASRYYDGDDLDSNVNGVWADMEQRMATAFAAELKNSVGGADYFCGPTYRRDPVTGQPVKVSWTEPDPADPAKTVPKEGTCPPVRISITDVIFADPGVAAARAKVATAQLEARASDIATDSKVRTANKLKAAGKEGADVQRQQNELLIEQERTKQVDACAKSGARCVVVNGGGGVNVGVGQ
jgi:hypothetical protein